MRIINDIGDIEAPRIYIFGAGQVAELLMLEIKKYTNTKVVGIILSNTNVERKQCFRDIDIYSIEDVDNKIPVIVATLPNLHREIFEYLSKFNIRQQFFVSEGLLRKMRSHFVPFRRDSAARKIVFSEMKKIAEKHNVTILSVVSNSTIDFAESITITQNSFTDSDVYRECVCILNINWDDEWQKLIIHAFSKCDFVAIAYRWNYIEYERFCLFNEAEKRNFKLVATQRIIRDNTDFHTENVIFAFRKESDAYLDELYEHRRLSKKKIEQYYIEQDVKHKSYDIGLVGNWTVLNYGSELTHYALYATLKDMGYSILMIECPEDSYKKPYGAPQLFESVPYQYYEIALPKKNHSNMWEYNKCCNSFVLGSDQLLNPQLYVAFGKLSSLDWVECSKKRIGYALSFGHSDIQYKNDDLLDLKIQLSLFDAISVRENSAVNIMNELFGISSKLVIEPVFLRNSDFYTHIAKNYLRNNHSLFAYLLDPTEKQVHILNDIAKINNLDLILIPDADDEYEHLYNIDNNEKVSIEKWLAGIINSEFVITDSFHAMCFALIFHKEFFVLRNNNRGGARFESLLSYLQLEERMISDISEISISLAYDRKIEYKKVDKLIETIRKQSLQWIDEALVAPHSIKVTEEFQYMQRQLRNQEVRMYES